jgi:hypothetical protein
MYWSLGLLVPEDALFRWFGGMVRDESIMFARRFRMVKDSCSRCIPCQCSMTCMCTRMLMISITCGTSARSVSASETEVFPCCWNGASTFEIRGFRISRSFCDELYIYLPPHGIRLAHSVPVRVSSVACSCLAAIRAVLSVE